MHRSILITLLATFAAVTLCFAQTDDALTAAAKQVAERFVESADAKRGEVAELDSVAAPKILYVSLGTKDGVHEGQLLEIAAKGDPIIVGGETIGFKETPIGTAEITRVQSDRLCMATVKNVTPGVAITKGSIAYLKPVPATLAVSTFLRPDNAATMMGQEFADKLGMALQASGRFQMVERTRLEAVLKELGLSLNDLFDPTKAARLGKQLQAKGVVMGTITQQNDRYAINARVVDVETGVQVAAAAVSCGRSTELDGKYSGGTVVADSPMGIAPPPTNVRVLYVGSDEDMVHNEGVKNLLTRAGLIVDARPSLPDSLSQYRVVIYDKTTYPNDRRQQESAAKALYAVAGSGRGVVLGGVATWEFGGLSGEMREASSWVGCGYFNYYRRNGGTLQFARSQPFGVTGSVGTTIHQFAGEMYCNLAVPEKLESSSQAVAQLVSGRENAIGAYANRFGNGRVYFQYLTYHPNSPRLNELFIGGVKWAAGLVELDGKTGFQ